MATTQTSPRDVAPHSTPPDHDASRPRRGPARPNRAATDLPGSPHRRPGSPSDDEILGLDSSSVGAQHAAPGDRPWRNDAHPSRSPAEQSCLPNGSASPSTDARRSGATPLRPADNEERATPETAAEPENLRAAFDANPELLQAWHDAHSYRESFATPEEARAATALLADLDRLDALFFSRRPEDHAELARAVANLDPDAFASLAHAMSGLATEAQRHRDADTGNRDATSSVGAQHAVPGTNSWRDAAHSASAPNAATLSSRTRPTAAFSQSADEGSAVSSSDGHRTADPSTPSRTPARTGENQTARDSAQDDSARSGPTPAQIEFFHSANAAQEGPPGRRSVEPGGSDTPPQRQSSGPTGVQIEFFHATNAAAVRNVLDAIESQVERLLPEGVSKSARNRVVGEIYRELDSTLQSNRQLAQQMRDAFRSGSLDTNHQRALVSLITSRARQALPGVAKRVLSEWTSTIVAANHDRRVRQRAAESRVDIAGSGRAGNDSRRSMTPRDIDYARLSDSDILNL